MGDREAFETFVAEQIPRIADFSSFSVTFQGKVRPLGEILYKWLRCTLAHEAELPPDIGFVPDPAPGRVEIGHHSGPPEKIVFTYSLVVLLADMVARAPENTDVPAALRDRLMSFVTTPRGAG